MNNVFSTRPATDAEIKAGKEFQAEYMRNFERQKAERAKLHEEMIAERRAIVLTFND